jgi:hypothetical protein
MDNKALWILAALLAVGGGYGACALSTSDDSTESLSGPIDPGPTMPDLRSDAGTTVATPTPVEPTQPTMPPPAEVDACEGACTTGEVCCPTTRECVPADCATCCAPDQTRTPVIPTELAPRGDGPAGPMPVPDVVEGGGGPRPPSPDPRIGQ